MPNKIENPRIFAIPRPLLSSSLLMSEVIDSHQQEIEALKAELETLRQIQDDLRESEERLQIVLKANNDGIWDWNIKSNQLFFSPRWKEILGYNDEEIPNQFDSWLNLLHEDDRSRVSTFLQAYLARKEPVYKIEFRLRCKNGDYKWILSRGKAIWDRRGNPIRMAGSHTDISDRKQRENALRNLATREHLLSEIARQLIDREFALAIQSVLQSIGELTKSERIYIIRYSDCQQEWSMIYEWYNSKNLQLESVIQEYQNQPLDTFPWFAQQLLNNQPIKINALEDLPEQATREKELFGQSTSPQLLVVSMTNAKKIVGYLGIEANTSKQWTAEDVNWLKLVGEFIAIAQARWEAEQALLTAKETADSANQAKSEFLAHMSHELRTPLNAILGFTQVMNRDPSLQEGQRVNLDIINRSGEHLLALINDILEMSKIEAGRLSFNPNSFDLYQLLESLKEMFSLKAKVKNLQLIVEYWPDVPQYIYTDGGKLRQILINLLSNAIKFTETGGVSLRVKTGEMAAISKNIRLVFEVEDTGIGINLDEENRIFEAFGQSKTGLNSQEGTGLGLTISQKFTQLLGGRIQLKSIVGQGSLFIFDILVEIADEKNIESHHPTRKVIGLAPNQPIYRILVVDDRLESRLLLFKLLSSVGFLVEQASNGQEALAVWKTWKPHLILMDLRMPIMDGYQTIEQIKKTSQGQETIIIALTASAFQENLNDVLVIEYNDFMQKPFREDLLWEKLAQHLKINYIYDSESEVQSKNLDSTELSEQAISQLKLMPLDWREKLLTAAQECSDDYILELVEEIPLGYVKLSHLLKELAHEFLFDSIIALLNNL